MFKKILFCLVILFSTVSCVAGVIAGGVATGLYINGKFLDTSNDKIIREALLKSFKAEDNSAYKDINVTVYGGRILLTGYTANPSVRSNAVKKAGAIKLGNEVINEIIINDDYGINSVKNNIVSSRIYSKLKYNKIKTSNYKYDIVNGKVYVIGAAQSEEEMRKILDVISRTRGVKKVINYILVVY